MVSMKTDPKKVIDYISNVSNHPAFISALKSVENLRGDPRRPGTNWDWSFVMAGVEIKGKAETVESVDGKLFSFKTTSGIHSTFTYSAEPEDDGTRFTLKVVYDVPDTVLSKVMDRAVVERLNEAEADRVAGNVKAIFES
jgi:uncharacterized membrane protein